jgi:hypothetical protein
MPDCGPVVAHRPSDAPRENPRKRLCGAICRDLALAMQRHALALERHASTRGTTMGIAEPNILRQTSDEDLVRQYLAIRQTGKRGSNTYQCVEMEMRARNLIRQSRLDTDYTGSSSRSSFSPRTSMFGSFR